MNWWFCRPWLHRRRIGILQRGPNEKLVVMWEKYAATKRDPELPLSDKTVSELIKLAEDLLRRDHPAIAARDQSRANL